MCNGVLICSDDAERFGGRSGRSHFTLCPEFVMMAAASKPVAVVCKFPFQVDGRSAYYVIDWHGVESELHVVGEDETEGDVIERLSVALWVTRPRGNGVGPVQRPLLRLL